MVDHAEMAAVLAGLARTVAEEFSVVEILRRLGDSVPRVLDVDGAGVMLVEGERVCFAHAGTDAADEVEHLQELLQEGPCRDSARTGEVVVEPDLSRGAVPWPRWAPRAAGVGLRSVVAVPLTARGRVWGVLDLYARRRDAFSAADVAAARTLADVATSYLVIAADRDAARAAQRELAYRASHDLLTGLPVRGVFLEQLGRALARLRRRPGRVALLFVDLDRLKYVNDTYGHVAGDALLHQCAARLRAAVRPSDVVARIGGDEFVVLLEELRDAAEAAGVAQRILRELSRPLPLAGGPELTPSASIGVAVCTDAETTGDALLSRADEAMYRAKRAGRGRWQLFDAATHTAETARDRLEWQLRDAVATGQLQLYYQPIVDVGTGRAQAVEALLRWHHPSLGLIDAGSFIGVAERSGLIVEIGAWAVATACRQLAEWDRELGPDAPRQVFVNISTAELAQPLLERRVDRSLVASGISADRLVLEITETGVLAEPERGVEVVEALRRRGCELAIDDFGTGYSSLRRLVTLPASTVKIDRLFTRELTTRRETAAVISAVLLMAHNLRRTVVAEGVEDAATAAALQELGCPLAQGYYFARPQPADAVARRLGAALPPAS